MNIKYALVVIQFRLWGSWRK